MFRRWITAALLLLASAAAASPLSRQMREVERLRGLKFEHDILQKTITRAELPGRIMDQMRESMPYSPDDYIQLLRVLQLVDGKSDALLSQMLDLYQSQVLAFYDPLRHVYYSVSETPKSVDGVPLDPVTLRDMVVIHELTHALQDQRFGAGAREATLTKDTDGELAFHSLLEGEASLVMLAYMLDKMGQPIDVLIQNGDLINSFVAQSDTAIPKETPRYFVESLKFPYVEGLRLVVEGYRRGGWKEIDRMDANPPRSTREVLHQDEYFARLETGRTAKAVQPAALIPAPRLLTVEHLGEFHWRYLVGADASRGWSDDRVEVAQNALCEPTVLAETKWESEERARAFHDAYVRFLDSRGVGTHSSIKGNVVRVAYGPDSELIAKFVGP